jgi:hypothetical protein
MQESLNQKQNVNNMSIDAFFIEIDSNESIESIFAEYTKELREEMNKNNSEKENILNGIVPDLNLNFLESQINSAMQILQNNNHNNKYNQVESFIQKYK